MFRAPLYSSSGESIVLDGNQTCTLDGHLHSWHIPDVILIQLILLMMSRGVL